MLGQGELGILVGVDGTLASDEACRYACAEASVHGLPLRLLTPGYPGRSIRTAPRTRHLCGGQNPRWKRRPGREDTRRLLQDALAGWRASYPDVAVTEVLGFERPLRALRTAVDDARMLVVGSHGRGTVWRYALGSVSSALLRAVACPVDVLGPKTAR